MPNRLAQESSPYLLQHAQNPVDWYPWGAAALTRAQEADLPIFLSIGYSACHWCHVMEHESFENEAIAERLNRQFVCIKVDREERPDLDQIYMNAVQLMTGRGGWPMSVFLTPDRRPFFGGTYWPPEPRTGMPGFGQVVDAVAQAWRDQREKVLTQAGELTRYLQQVGRSERVQEPISLNLLQHAVAQLERAFDYTHGGFGRAPKFPHTMDLQLLLRIWRRTGRDGLLEMVQLNLDRMARGGIYDHLGGGFARYSVDQRWLVPHFEKMLYDNSLLARVYLDAFQVTRDPLYARVVHETLDYVLQIMTDPLGGFYSTEDADSEGEEGKFYVWTPAEIEAVLGAEAAARFCYVYDVTEAGNFEGRNILNLPKTVAQCAQIKGWDEAELEAELAVSRARLNEVRALRVRPGKDDKVLVSWNALMIDAMARAAVILTEPRYATAAARAARFLLEQVCRPDGRLLHGWRQGQAKLDAYLDDYSCLINSLVTLYETQSDESWIDHAVRLADILLNHFLDRDGGGFFYTADDHETLITRNKDLHDSSVPSGNSMAAMGLLRLGKLTGRADYLAAAQATLAMAEPTMREAASATGQMLLAADHALGPCPELVLLGDRRDPEMAAVLHDLWQRYVPNRVLAVRHPAAADATRSPHLEALFAGKQTKDGELTLFICENFACQQPIRGREAMLACWEQLAIRG
jgi:uncharacterized protein YyaL (SSP411 family)